ncbi:sulfite exporter TauE/SafE family protein [candidate division KSB1 bacterium]
MELWILLFLGGSLAGILGGLLGIGGGILLLPLLRFIVGLPPAYAAGTCIVAVLFTSAGGSYRHYKLGHIHYRSLVPVIIAGALSTIVFSVFFLYMTKKSGWLDLGTGLVFSFVSIRMIIEGVLDIYRKSDDEQGEPEIRGSLSRKITIGGIAGIFPGLLGIGTGAVLVPSFKFILNTPIKIAVGSSLACFAVNALLSSAVKLMQGFVDIGITLPLSIGTLIGANVGARLNKNLPSPVIKIVFGLVFTVVVLKYFNLFFESVS